MFSLALALEAFGENGRLKNDVLQKRFDDTIGCFLDLVEAAKHYPGLKKQWIEFLGEQPNPGDRSHRDERRGGGGGGGVGRCVELVSKPETGLRV